MTVKRIADFMGILFRSRLVKFASKEEMLACDDPVIEQFLRGRPEGPVGMDEMVDDTDASTPRPAAGPLAGKDRARPSQPAALASRGEGPLIIPVPRPADRAPADAPYSS